MQIDKALLALCSKISLVLLPSSFDALISNKDDSEWFLGLVIGLSGCWFFSIGSGQFSSLVVVFGGLSEVYKGSSLVSTRFKSQTIILLSEMISSGFGGKGRPRFLLLRLGGGIGVTSLVLVP